MSSFTQCVLAGSLFAVVIPAQETSEPLEDTGLIITTEAKLVLVPLHVYQKKNSVGGLGPEAFELSEDGTTQKIAFVEGPPADPESSAPREVPTEIILLIDVSHSVMRRGLLDITTIRETILDGLREDVAISVYGFARNLKRFTGPTRDFAKLQRAMELAYEAKDGGSRVYEAIMQTARDAANRGGGVSRMMVVFSDGFSTTGLSSDLVVRSANAFGIPIYPVVLGHQEVLDRAHGRGPSMRKRRNPTAGMRRESRARAQELRQSDFADIGPRTGGRSYDPRVINNVIIREILTSLAKLVETEYVVGYYPASVDEQLTPHEVEVRLVDQKVGKLYGGRRLIVH